ncbi:MAG: M55 family metallopeptidase [Candidatus Limnocylindrales bacterium]
MRVYISVDMEGIGGINDPHPTDPADRRYATSVALMVGETNAAIEGALAAGATDILVNDSHWNMYNLLPEDLHEAARVLQGEKAWSMVAGAQPRPAAGLPGESPAFDVALFVGYHARAGHPRGTIAHTYSGKPVETRLDGRPTGEYGINAVVLGAWGIPVGMISGDDALAEEVQVWLPWAERVIVKEADGTGSAISVHPRVARDLVRAGAERAVRAAAAGAGAGAGAGGGLRLLEVGPPVVIEVDYARGVVADHAAILPGAERVGDRTVRFTAHDPVTAYRGFVAINRLADATDA